MHLDQKTLQKLKTFAFFIVIVLSLLLTTHSIWQSIHTIYTKPKESMPSFKMHPRHLTKTTQSTKHHELFGKYLPNSSSDKSIPKTMLNLKLVGILKAIPERKSLAIIEVVGGHEKVYQVGDMLPGNAKLIRILKDGILLYRQNKVERLVLPKKTLNQQKPKPLEL